MAEPTVSELARQLQHLSTRIDGTVSKEVHELSMRSLIEDIADIKQWQQRMTWTLIANFIGIIIAILTLLLTRGVGP